MISWAKQEWIPQLKQIWKECFMDEQEYIDFYFANRFEKNNTLVYLIEDCPVAMASLFPALCWKKRGKEKVRYIYAVATEKRFQGQGISTKLLNYILAYLDQKNEIGILVPASEDLISFYDKRGFYPAIQRDERIHSEEGIILKAASISENKTSFHCTRTIPAKETYKKIRDKRLGNEGYIEWDCNAIGFAMKDNAWQGGFTYEFVLNKENHILMAYCEDRQLIVKESSLNDGEWQTYGMQIARFFDCDHVVRKGIYSMSNRKEWANSAYFNLALDG